MKKLTLIILMMLLLFNFYNFSDFLNCSYADIPRTMNYQGKLTDKQGYTLNGSYNVTFRIYDAPTLGNLLWQESHEGISVSKGLFNVLLGTITPLNLTFDKQYYLAIKVGADPEMTPRQPLASAPYAFIAGSLGKSEIPTGTIMIWSSDTPPNGWLLCDGSAVSRITYANLFAAIGITYGAGDGSITFNLPDLRGRIPLGKDNMGGLSANRVTDAEADMVGNGGGSETKTTSTSSDNVKFWPNDSYVASQNHRHTVNVIQPYLTIVYIIKI
ncbi:MAG: tail fiber protein [Candidatus Omnitrophica bacterium]|nr:tail fiber protein [Candidatus Omnitrophota bacterium]